MENTDNFKLVDMLAEALEQAEEWDRIQRTDPAIRAAEQAMTDQYNVNDTLYGCVYGVVNAYVRQAILYGFRAGIALMYEGGRKEDQHNG